VTTYRLLPQRLEGSRVRLEATGPDASRVVRLADGKAIGVVELEYQGETIFLRSLCVDEAERGYGAGSEAAWLLIDGAAVAGFTLLRAWAPPHLGLAVYFWARMGFHALHGPGPDGGIWFERALRR
jgi:N-acetylglutamate synthase-like GNAT family acetyltransferase